MNRIILFSLLCLIAVSASAQTDAIISDTTYTEQRGGMLFYIQKITYTSGRVVTDERPASAIDTAQEVNSVISAIFPELEQYAQAAVSFSRSRDINRKIRTADQAVKSLSGKTLFEEMDRRLRDLALEGDYRLRQNRQNADVTISRNAQGALRLREAGTNYIISVVSRSWIRVRYKNNADLELFWDAQNLEWEDATGNITLRRLTNSVQNK